MIDRDQVSGHGGSNVINRALGVDRDVEVEVKQIQLRDGARFLLCSDGIYRHLSDEEIARVLAENKEPQRAADELKRLVHERGADDNLTAVVVQAGRARVGPVLVIDDGSGEAGTKKPQGDRAAKAGAALATSDRRIRVEFGEPRLQRDSTGKKPSGLDRNAESSEDRKLRNASPSRVLMYVLIGLVLMAGSFYAGLRASEWRNTGASDAGDADELRAGREAFDRRDYQAAGDEFESLVKLNPQNATALYWLGRARLEGRDYAAAAKDFEVAISREPRMFDAYIQAVAAYQLLGEKAKVAEMLARHADERRNAERPVMDNQR